MHNQEHSPSNVKTFKIHYSLRHVMHFQIAGVIISFLFLLFIFFFDSPLSFHIENNFYNILLLLFVGLAYLWIGYLIRSYLTYQVTVSHDGQIKESGFGIQTRYMYTRDIKDITTMPFFPIFMKAIDDRSLNFIWNIVTMLSVQTLKNRVSMVIFRKEDVFPRYPVDTDIVDEILKSNSAITVDDSVNFAKEQGRHRSFKLSKVSRY